jgi:hypothetical protein
MPDTEANALPASFPLHAESALWPAEGQLLELARLANDRRRDHQPLPGSAGEVERFVNDFLAPVRQWFLGHADRVSRCYVSCYEHAPTYG